MGRRAIGRIYFETVQVTQRIVSVEYIFGTSCATKEIDPEKEASDAFHSFYLEISWGQLSVGFFLQNFFFICLEGLTGHW